MLARRYFYKILLGLSIILVILLVPKFSASAMPPDEYLKALKIANRHVEKQKQRSSTHAALSSAFIKEFFGRYYKVGDWWEIAAVHIDPGTARMTNDPKSIESKERIVGIFRYEVVKVKGGESPEVILEVSQVRKNGLDEVDSKIDRIVMTVNDRLIQGEKTYFFRSDSRPVNIVPGAMRSSVTPLELLPLDSIDIKDADRSKLARFPELPPKLSRVAQQAGFTPKLSSSFIFELMDFFGRPTTVIWQHGDPWPVYQKTAQGLAILIGKVGQ